MREQTSGMGEVRSQALPRRQVAICYRYVATSCGMRVVIIIHLLTIGALAATATAINIGHYCYQKQHNRVHMSSQLRRRIRSLQRKCSS